VFREGYSPWFRIDLQIAQTCGFATIEQCWFVTFRDKWRGYMEFASLARPCKRFPPLQSDELSFVLTRLGANSASPSTKPISQARRPSRQSPESRAATPAPSPAVSADRAHSENQRTDGYHRYVVQAARSTLVIGTIYPRRRPSSISEGHMVSGDSCIAKKYCISDSIGRRVFHARHRRIPETRLRPAV
jgi:hypothetical protein